ncbi:MAG: helix-turn-helix domain-containing protein [Rhizomicrobium sp.]
MDLSKVDWSMIARSRDNDIAAQIASDPDTSPVFTDAELARARRVVPEASPRSVRTLRRRLGLTQREFADRYGFSVETIRNYEQGHRRPTGPARVLLQVIANEPDAITRALAALPHGRGRLERKSPASKRRAQREPAAR